MNRWYACDITAGRDLTIGEVFDQAGRRDPGHRRTWIVLADGDNHQIKLIQDQAARIRVMSSWARPVTSVVPVP